MLRKKRLQQRDSEEPDIAEHSGNGTYTIYRVRISASEHKPQQRQGDRFQYESQHKEKRHVLKQPRRAVNLIEGIH